jgi:ATP-binding cassette subfamily B protein
MGERSDPPTSPKEVIFLLIKTVRANSSRTEILLICSYLSLFVIASIVDCLRINSISNLLSILQYQATTDPANLRSQILSLPTTFLFLHLFCWMLHGPARVIERLVAFRLASNLKIRLIHQATLLPLKYHQENHSGVIIHKIERAANTFQNFMERIFGTLYMITGIVLPHIALVYYLPLSGFVGILCTFTSWKVVQMFDKRITPQYEQLDQFRNKVENINCTHFFSFLFSGRFQSSRFSYKCCYNKVSPIRISRSCSNPRDNSREISYFPLQY